MNIWIFHSNNEYFNNFEKLLYLYVQVSVNWAYFGTAAIVPSISYMSIFIHWDSWSPHFTMTQYGE